MSRWPSASNKICVMHNRKLNRLEGFDYSANRNYFITICVDHHIQSFGAIENKSMNLSCNGIIAMEQWIWLGNQYPYIDLVSFVIMPDHIHGIIKINPDYYYCVGNGRDHSLHKTETDHSENKTQTDHSENKTETDHSVNKTETDHSLHKTETDHSIHKTQTDHSENKTETDHSQQIESGNSQKIKPLPGN